MFEIRLWFSYPAVDFVTNTKVESVLLLSVIIVSLWLSIINLKDKVPPFDVAVFSKYFHTKYVKHQTKYPSYHPPPNIAETIVKNLETVLTAAHSIH